MIILVKYPKKIQLKYETLKQSLLNILINFELERFDDEFSE